MRHAECEDGEEALTTMEGNSGLVSVTEVVGCVRCVVLYLCVIPMRMHDATGVAANVGEQHRDARRSADDRRQHVSSYVKYTHSVLSVRSVHSVFTILSFMGSMNLRPNQCRNQSLPSILRDTWVLSIQP